LTSIAQSDEPGLSPRVRGNDFLRGGNDGLIASIPARAGERLFRPCCPGSPEVYPRACGGTTSFAAATMA
jgi:hypothetical protein